jgi:hypothetical protein
MRPGVKIGQKRYAQGTSPLRPPRDLQMKTANNVPLSAADLGKPSFATEFVAKRRAGEGAAQSAASAAPGNFAHVLLRHPRL